MSSAPLPSAPTEATPSLPPVRLQPAGGQPMVPSLANHVALDASANTAYLDFGFIEPQAYAGAMAAAAQADGAPAPLDGVLVARMAIPVEALALLHLQSGAFLKSLQSRVGDLLASMAKQTPAGAPPAA